MLVYCLKRLLSLIPVATGVVVLVSLMTHVVPGDPVDRILGPYATLEDKQELKTKLGLDKPVAEQILSYFAKLGRLDFGTSLLEQVPVTELIKERVLPTAELALIAIIVACFIAIPLGVLSALFAGTVIDLFAMALALIGVAIPNFWFGSLLILIFSLHFNLFPVSERTDWTSYVLPAITLGTALAAALSRMTRNSMLDTMREDFVKTARAKGVHEFLVIFKHIFRNASLPLVTILGLQFGVILTGAIITEIIFDWPGLGSLMLDAVQNRNYPLIQGLVLMFSATYLIVNLMTDIIYAFIDPRIKIGGH